MEILHRSLFYAQIKDIVKCIQEVIKIEFNVTRETYGPRRLSKHLKQKSVNVGRDHVERLMKENNIIPKQLKSLSQPPIRTIIILWLKIS